MIPDVINLGPIAIHSFGLMLVCCLLAGSMRLEMDLRAAKLNSAVADKLVLWAGISGVVGARIFYALTYFSDFLRDPWSVLFAGGGFVFYGGFLVAAVVVAAILRQERWDFFTIADLVVPTLAIGYAVGRLGCHLSGDGDYGIASALPWAVSYSLGVIPTPPGIRVHPTPVYESLISFCLCLFFVRLRARKILAGRGQVFGLYLILSGIARFFIEYIRIEPVVFAGFTEAQVISVILALIGVPLLLGWKAVR